MIEHEKGVGEVWEDIKAVTHKPTFRLGEHLYIFNYLLRTLHEGTNDFHNPDTYRKLEKFIQEYGQVAGFAESFKHASNVCQKEAEMAAGILLENDKWPFFKRRVVIVLYSWSIFSRFSWNEHEAFDFTENVKRTIYADNADRYKEEDRLKGITSPTEGKEE